MRRFAAAVVAAMTMAAVALAADAGTAAEGAFGFPPKPGGFRPGMPFKPSKGRLPTFESDLYTLALEKLETRAKVELAERGDREHTIKLDGKIIPPEDKDVVAVTKQLKVLRIVDAEEKNLRVLTKPRIGGTGGSSLMGIKKYQPNTYVGILGPEADVEVPTTKLLACAYRIHTMELGATALLAKERASKTLPAIVMEKPEELFPGLRVRIMTLRMTADRKLTIIAKYTRPKPGPTGPFIEQVDVLDENGKSIARGKWKLGDPFSNQGTLTAELPVPAGKTHKDLTFIACTSHTKKILKFVVTGIFQK